MSGKPARPAKQLCPVCRHPKAKHFHLVCPSCWSHVPAEDQQAVYDLNRRARGTARHVHKCRAVVRVLFEKKRAAQKRKMEQL